MFDLEQAIGEWRKQMLAAGIKTPVPLEELESHLRDEIEQQMESGLEPQKALALAVHNIGQVQILKTEFIKIGGVRKRGRFTTLLSLIGLICLIPWLTYDLFKHEMSMPWRLVGIVDIGLITLAFLGNVRVNNLFPVIPNHRTRSLIGNSFLVGGVIFGVALNHFGGYFFLSPGPQWVVTQWSFTLTIAGAIISSGLEGAAKQAASLRVS